MKTGRLLVIFLMAASLLSCSTSPRKEKTAGQGTVSGDPSAAERLMAAVVEINDNAPVTISTSFTADGISNGQKFKIEGTALFDRKGYYRIAVVDYVFRSRILEAYRDMDSLYFNYPAEKKLLIDNVNSIDLYRYTGFQTDFALMHTLLTGGIPLLRDSVITKCVAGSETDSFNLVLENGDYMENIYFRKNVPERIMIIHKVTKDKMEIYLKSRVTRDKSSFFKSIRIVAPGKNISVNIKFSSTTLNGKIRAEKFKPGKIKKGVTVIRVN